MAPRRAVGLLADSKSSWVDPTWAEVLALTTGVCGLLMLGEKLHQGGLVAAKRGEESLDYPVGPLRFQLAFRQVEGDASDL